MKRLARLSNCLLAAVLALFANASDAIAASDDQFVFPFHQTDLGSSTFIAPNYWHPISTSGPNAGSTGGAVDISAYKWNNSSKKYERCFGDGECTKDVGNPNTDSYTFGLPVYAPVSGFVVACGRSYPDNPSIGPADPGRSSDPTTIPAPGNYVLIKNSRSSKSYLIAHLKKNSIPLSVCPNSTVGEDLVNAQGGIWEQNFISPNQRPWVEIGTKVGEAGSSGASGSPHSHVHVERFETQNGDAFGQAELGENFWPEYFYAYMAPFNKSKEISVFDWTPMVGTSFGQNTSGTKAVYASPLLRVASGAQPGSFSDLDVVYLSSTRPITAKLRSEDRRLVLTSWESGDQSTNITILDSNTSAYAYKVRLAAVDDNKILVALEDNDHNLRLRLYEVSNDGGFVMIAEELAGTINRLEIAKTANNQYITAVRLANGNLKLIAWSVTASGHLDRHGEYTLGDVKEFDITRGANFPGVVVAARLENDNLKVIPFAVSSDGESFTRKDDLIANFNVRQVSVASIPKGVVVAAKDTDDKLTVASFKVESNTGNLLKQSSISTGGKVQSVVVNNTPQSGADVITTVRTGAGDLKLITYMMGDDGANMYRGDGASAGVVSLFATASTKTGGSSTLEDQFLTAVKDEASQLKLIRFRTNLKGSITFAGKPLETEQIPSDVQMPASSTDVP